MIRKTNKKRLAKKAGVTKSVKSGMPPGTMVHIGERLTEKDKIELISYNSQRLETEESTSTAKIYPLLVEGSNHWLNIDGLHNIKLIENIGKHFHLHPLLLEDIVNTEQRPKAEEHETCLFFTLKALNKIEDGEVIYEQISFVLGSNYLITFQEREGDHFDQVRKRMDQPESKTRQNPVDYLFYRLIDIIIDSYYILLEHFGDRLENLEDKVYIDPSEGTLHEVQELKKELIFLRKTVYPLREAVKKVMTEPNFIHDHTRQYIADVYDHTVHVIETVESYRDLSTSLIDMYMTGISNRMNEIMKVLTIIATIFIPLTFIVGVYGMNFDYMPELHWKYSYPIVWLVMIIISIGMLIYFRRKKWL